MQTIQDEQSFKFLDKNRFSTTDFCSCFRLQCGSELRLSLLKILIFCSSIILIFFNVALKFHVSWLLIFLVLPCLLNSRQVPHMSYPRSSSAGAKLRPHTTPKQRTTRVRNDMLVCKLSFRTSPPAVITPQLDCYHQAPLILQTHTAHTLAYTSCRTIYLPFELWALWGQRWSLFHLCTYTALYRIGFTEDI